MNMPSPLWGQCENLLWTVIPSPSLVILSGAKNLALLLRVDSARNLALSVFTALRDSSSPAARRNDSKNEISLRRAALRMTRGSGLSAAC
jgi:hypothetical protein